MTNNKDNKDNNNNTYIFIGLFSIVMFILIVFFAYLFILSGLKIKKNIYNTYKNGY